MKILIAADSFKDALGSVGVCTAIYNGCKQGMPDSIPFIFPIADGGDGTSDVIKFHLDFNVIEVETLDPLFRPTKSDYLLSTDGRTAFIELAKASGLEHLKPHDRNPVLTSTFGAGVMIQDAISRDATHIILSIGGSATNDAGIGLASALGYQFEDKLGQTLQCNGQALQYIENHHISATDLAKIKNTTFEVLCDVNNPLYGTHGAAYTYAVQKGADELQVKILDSGLQHLAEVCGATRLAMIPGAGAAGGVGFGAMYFLGATLVKGFDTICRWTGFEKHISDADIIITGEGKFDNQTKNGKVIQGVARLAKKYKKPVFALCGEVSCRIEDIENMNFARVISISQHKNNLDQNLVATASNLTKASCQLMQDLQQSRPF